MSFRVVTYNILADAYVKPHRYPESSADALETNARRQRLLERIQGLNADVYCLQEVEQASFSDLEEQLQSEGFRGFFEQKNGRPDGSAIFVRESLFEVVDVKPLHYKACESRDDQLALIAHLKYEGREFAIASTHLRWQPPRTMPEEHLGLRQLSELIEERETLAPGVDAWILAGDMNAISESCVIHSAIGQGFRLACRTQRPWDTSNINGKRRKLDYLLYTPEAFTPRPGVLPQLERNTPMPSLTEPSDHLPVDVEFSWK